MFLIDGPKQKDQNNYVRAINELKSKFKNNNIKLQAALHIFIKLRCLVVDVAL